MLTYPFKFPKIKGRLIRRINRFVIEVEIDGSHFTAYLPNPGRLWELFIPGTELILTNSAPDKKHPYIVIACQKNDQLILLHTHLTNKIVRFLIEEKALPAFEAYNVVKEEAVAGKHRIDLLLEHETSGILYYLEVKSCTLFAGKLAMFPDAVTKRGASHLQKLKNLSAAEIKTGCLFVIMHPQVKYFLPAYHVDPDFARTFLSVIDKVELQAIAIGFDRKFHSVTQVNEAIIPRELLDEELEDRGSYMLIIELNEALRLTVGSLGELSLKPGYYVYVGSAMKNLSKRIARHLRKKKKTRWHIDYLTLYAVAIKPVPIISSEYLECSIAADLKAISENTVNGFGSSDCHCSSHLFYFTSNPLQQEDFIRIIEFYRMDRVTEKIIGSREKNMERPFFHRDEKLFEV